MTEKFHLTAGNELLGVFETRLELDRELISILKKPDQQPSHLAIVMIHVQETDEGPKERTVGSVTAMVWAMARGFHAPEPIEEMVTSHVTWGFDGVPFTIEIEGARRDDDHRVAFLSPDEVAAVLPYLEYFARHGRFPE